MRRILLIVFVVILAVGLFLVLPPLGSFSNDDLVAAPGSFVHSKTDTDQLCKPNTVYVTEEARKIHEREGYDFIVDDRCADLQKRLLESINRDNLTEVRELISMGANAQTADLSTHQAVFPLQVAAYKSSESVKILLENGADVNQEYCCCAMCMSPLTKAISGDRIENAQLLIQYGADLDYRPSFSDGDKPLPLELAIEGGNGDMIQLVRSACERTLGCRVKSRAGRIGIRY